MNKTPAQQDAARAFRLISDADEPLEAAEEICLAIALAAEGLSEHGGPIQRLAWLAVAEIQKAEALRAEAFHITHPYAFPHAKDQEAHS